MIDIFKAFLQKIPEINLLLKWTTGSDELVTVYKENIGLYNKIAQLLFKKPRVTYIHLDKKGSFLWRQINGISTAGDIIKIMNEQFGDDYLTVNKYFQILTRCNLIHFN